jgi:hypothetical protein
MTSEKRKATVAVPVATVTTEIGVAHAVSVASKNCMLVEELASVTDVGEATRVREPPHPAVWSPTATEQLPTVVDWACVVNASAVGTSGANTTSACPYMLPLTFVPWAHGSEEDPPQHPSSKVMSPAVRGVLSVWPVSDAVLNRTETVYG